MNKVPAIVWIAAAIAGVYFLTQRTAFNLPKPPPGATLPAAGARPAVAITPVGLSLDVPGIGSYFNPGTGGAPTVSLDAGVFTTLFGGGQAQPVPVGTGPYGGGGTGGFVTAFGPGS